DASQPAVITDESGTASVTVTTTGRIYTRLNYNGSSGPAETWSAPPPVAGGLPGTVVVSLSQPGAMLAIYTDPGTQLVICRA
ncbi:MAG TPA: hypothetical protein VKQ07_00850, partial [Jatrophihabitantaceae bacterium]|nr:hypothetical protein [Jatrophihabitantaceae bacterium]